MRPGFCKQGSAESPRHTILVCGFVSAEEDTVRGPYTSCTRREKATKWSPRLGAAPSMGDQHQQQQVVVINSGQRPDVSDCHPPLTRQPFVSALLCTSLLSDRSPVGSPSVGLQWWWCGRRAGGVGSEAAV